MTMVDPGRFPNIVGALREAGLDPTTQRVPVAPAAHYVMGGIVTDLDGRTSVERLYAVGECACTGLHGANRLASNSLSECFVFGRRAALAGLDDAGARRPATRSTPRSTPPTPRDPRRRLAPGRPGARRAATRRARATTRTRSPASSPPPRSPARRPAAPTAAPSSPTSTRARRAATRSSTPTPRPRASRHGRTPDRLGRRPDDEHDGLVRRVQRARGPRRARGPARVPRRPAGAPGADRPRERRRSRSPSSSAGWPRHSASTRDGLAQRLTADVQARRRDARRRHALPRRRHPHRARLELVGARRLRRDLRRAFDVVVLSQELGIRKPDAADLHDRARTRSDCPPSAACSSMTWAETSSPPKRSE